MNTKKKLNKLINNQKQKKNQEQIRSSNNVYTNRESTDSENTQNIIGEENKEYFKKISKSGMKKIEKTNSLYLEKEYYKCIIYIFSLTIILLNKGTDELKINALRKIQHHLKKMDENIKDLIINNYYNELFQVEYVHGRIEYTIDYKIYPGHTQKNLLGEILLKDGIDKSKILNILGNYNDVTELMSVYKNNVNKNNVNSNKLVFYQINPNTFNPDNFDFRKNNLDDEEGLLRKGYIEYNKKLGGGGYADVYEITKMKNIVLKILKIGAMSSINRQKKIDFMEEYNSIKIISELQKKCKNAIMNVFDYGIVHKDYFNELYFIMEKGLLTLKGIKEKRNLGLNQKDKIELIKLLIELIIISVKKIKCIHDNNYLHLDVKDENIMIFKGNKNNHDIEISDNMTSKLNLDTNYIIVKYIDFGFSAKVDDKKIFNEQRGIIKNNFKGTGHYLYVNKNKSDGKYLYSKYSDLFSLSRILLEIIIKNMDYFNKIDKKRENKNKKQLPSGSYIKVINDNDIELFFKEIGIKPSNNEKSNLISIIKDILPDKDDNIKCIIEKDESGKIKKSTKTRLPFIVENCHDVYIKNIEKFLNNLVGHLPKK